MKINGEINSYSDYLRVIKGHTSKTLHALYDKTYFQKHVGGPECADQFFRNKGLSKTRYTELPLKLADIKQGERILDIGCGRGEIVFQTALLGAFSTGVDYSADAIEIANSIKSLHKKENPFVYNNVEFICADAEKLSFPDKSFDKVFLLDVVEHVSREELINILQEIKRVLRPYGKLIIHTSPNVWTRTYGYYIQTLVHLIVNRKRLIHPIVENYRALKTNPDLDADKIFLHVNEQSVMSLKCILAKSGFKSRVWLQDTINRQDEIHNKQTSFKSKLKDYVYRYFLLSYLLDGNLYAIARHKYPRRIVSIDL